jgi:acetyl esterase/lipase
MDDAFHPFDQPSQLRALIRRNPDYRDIQYAVVEGFRPLLMDLTLPKDALGVVPVVMCIHGGAWLTGSHKATPDDYVGYPIVWDALLDQGLAVASIQYRHSSEAPFPAQIHDAKAAVRWLRRFGPELGVDPERLGVWGESSGGHLAGLLAMNTTDPLLEGTVGVLTAPSTIRAAVLWYPPTDLTTIQQQMKPGSWVTHDQLDSPETRLLGARVVDVLKFARQASTITHVNSSAATVLLVHGEADEVVPFAQSEVLHKALKDVGVTTTLIAVAGADHCFEGVDLYPLAAKTAEEFARRLLI